MINMTKAKICYLVLFLLLSALLPAAEVIPAKVMPENIIEGDNGVLRLTAPIESQVSGVSDLPDVPGLRWQSGHGISRRVSIINGKQTGSLTVDVRFIPEKAGTYTIPAIQLPLGNGVTGTTQPVTFTVRKAPEIKNEADAAQQLVFAQLEIAGKTERKTFYSGEDIPLLLTVFIREPYMVEPSGGGSFQVIPETCGQVVGDIMKYPPYTRRIGDHVFQAVRYGFSVRATASGTASVRVILPMTVLENHGFFPRPVASRNIRAELKTLTIEPMPPPPSDVPFSGLTGSGWTGGFTLSPAPYRSGDALTLKLEITGSGSTEAFVFPGVKSEKFRSYPPEIQRGRESVRMTQTLIPLESGTIPLETAFSVFDAPSGKYRTISFRQELNIEKGAESPLPPEVKTPATDPAETTAASSTTDHNRNILYLHETDPADTVRLPLWKNAVAAILWLLGAGLAVFAVALLLVLRRRLQEKDPVRARRAAARAGKRAFLKRVEGHFTGDGLPPEISEEVTEYLNALQGLPPGTSMGETADRVSGSDPELGSMLRTLSSAAWAPAGVRKHFNDAYKKRFLHALSRFGVIVLCFLSTSLAAAGKDAALAYDRGDFAQALTLYQGQLRHGNGSADVLYNIGNCYFQMNDLPRALAAYEQAKYLAPRDPDIRENLNLTRRKLGLAEKSVISSPADVPGYLRDLLRLDEWLIAGAAGLMLWFFGAGLGMLFGRKLLLIMGIAGCALIIPAVVSIAAQPSRDVAVVVENNAPVYTLPSELSGKVEYRLRAGREVTVGERRLHWVRVRVDGNGEGWMPERSIMDCTP